MNELSKNLKCISIRNGVEIWLEHDRAENLIRALENLTDKKFINIDGQIINTSDIVGVFDAVTMADTTRRKNFEWKCKKGTWHAKNQLCDCSSQAEEFVVPPDERTEEEKEADARGLEKLRQMAKTIGSG